MAWARLSAIAFDFEPITSQFRLDDESTAEALAENESASDSGASDRLDRTDIPFVTIDPPGSEDIDQPVHIEKQVGLGTNHRHCHVGS